MQQQIFDFICIFVQRHDQPPTYAQIGDEFGLSVPAIQSHIDLIEKKGYVRRFGRGRGLQILKPSTQVSIPIVGRIAAGVPSLAQEDIVGTVEELPFLNQTTGRIALKVTGDSMINAHIMDGDLVVIQTNAELRNGDIAAVMIDGEATLKRIYFEPKKVVLKAENPAYAPIIIQPDEVDAKVVGKLVAVIREAYQVR